MESKQDVNNYNAPSLFSTKIQRLATYICRSRHILLMLLRTTVSTERLLGLLTFQRGV